MTDTSDDFDKGEEPSLFLNFKQLYAEGVPEVKWLIPRIVPDARYTLIFSEPGHGKSLLALWMAVTMAAKGLKVLYIDNEMNTQDVLSRLQGWHVEPDMIPDLHYALHTIGEIHEDAVRILATVARLSIDLVVIDTFRSSTLLEENSAEAVNQFQKLISQPLKIMEVGLLVLDHSGKNTEAGPRGSIHKTAIPDLVWGLEMVEDAVGPAIQPKMKLSRFKSRMPEVSDYVIIEIFTDQLVIRDL